MLSFEYFREIDTSGTGSFLMKLQTDLSGKNYNAGQIFTQLTQTIKFWKPKVYLGLSYSGGLGVTSSSSGFYITNAFGLGISYPFQFKGAWISTNLLLRYNAFDSPSYDPQLTVYFGKEFFNYRLFLSGSFTFWTENKNQGNDYTKNLRGKKFAFFGDPQIWVKIHKGISVGSRISVLYNLVAEKNQIRNYPTIGLKYQF
jgi:hypothetical protein